MFDYDYDDSAYASGDPDYDAAYDFEGDEEWNDDIEEEWGYHNYDPDPDTSLRWRFRRLIFPIRWWIQQNFTRCSVCHKRRKNCECVPF